MGLGNLGGAPPGLFNKGLVVNGLFAVIISHWPYNNHRWQQVLLLVLAIMFLLMLLLSVVMLLVLVFASGLVAFPLLTPNPDLEHFAAVDSGGRGQRLFTTNHA